MRTYSELMQLPTFEERFLYLELDGKVGEDTFGFDRYLNQVLYRSSEWKHIRREIIIRDNGCDLAIPDREIFGRIIIHHMNPISVKDIEERNPDVFNPEYLITTTKPTHDAIHYGDDSYIDTTEWHPRTPYDTCAWREP